MSKTREAIEKELDANIPRDAVSSRSGGGPKQLSYLETWYVIDRLNKVFGNLGWDSETVEMTLVSAPDALPAYRSKVRITVSCPAYESDGTLVGFRNVTKEGTGWGSDKSKMNAHEMACKEAESDALKRAAMKLGISMGLGLYDKSGEHVEDTPKATVPKESPGPGADELNKRQPDQYIAKAYALHKPALAALAPNDTNRDTLNKQITAMSKVVIAKQLKTLDELKAQMKADYGVDAAKDMKDDQAKDLLTKLETLANGK